MNLKKIFEPGKIGNLILKNRIIMSPIGTRLTSGNGGVTDAMCSFYAERAKGGAAAIIIEAAGVKYPEAVGKPNHLRICDDSYIPGHSLLVERIHENGALAVSMLWHCGINKGILEGMPPVGPSAIRNPNTGLTPHELTVDEIHEIQDRFADAALRAKIAGYDAIDLHGGHGYLISSFIPLLTNQRKDEYGGSFENRTRFVLEIIQKIRAKVGKNYPIMIRINSSDFIDGGITIEDSIKFAQVLEKAGVAAIDVSAGVYGSVDTMIEAINYKEAWKIDLAAKIKESVSIPVIGVGVLRSPEVVEKILEEGKVDFAALGRELLCEPHWVNLVKERGDDHILKCISCNACFARTGKNLPIRCAVNPYVGRESDIIHPVEKKKKVAVVGAGPSGITAALIASRRGCDVTLFEKDGKVGGQVILAAIPPGKDKITHYLDYLQEELDRSTVTCVLNHEFKVDEAKGYDDVIIACGSSCRSLAIKGCDTKDMILSWDALLLGEKAFGKKNIVVVGGGFVGCETALHCAVNHAHSVTIIELLPTIGGDVDNITSMGMKNELKEDKVKIFTSNSVVEVKDSHAFLKNGESIPCDLVVIAVGSKPQIQLREALYREGRYSYAVGEVAGPGRIQEAVDSGYEIALSL